MWEIKEMKWKNMRRAGREPMDPKFLVSRFTTEQTSRCYDEGIAS